MSYPKDHGLILMTENILVSQISQIDVITKNKYASMNDIRDNLLGL